jgi:hypothetical protein
VSEFGALCGGQFQQHEVMADENDGTTVWDRHGAGGDETRIVNPVRDDDQHRATEVASTAWPHYSADEPKDPR